MVVLVQVKALRADHMPNGTALRHGDRHLQAFLDHVEAALAHPEVALLDPATTRHDTHPRVLR